jgi:hypothetical protein
MRPTGCWRSLAFVALLPGVKMGLLLAAAPLPPEPPATTFPWPAVAIPQFTAAAAELQTSGFLIQV